ncbi:acyltransferase [Anaerosporobacter faecicola]|uniref:acyltransferase n=1 Tax=Anaerosporobacter faecicola TaxID=2718714 RepID=UPI001438E57E|nr:acyltransferase family protein [Anaerosporobacter faecicola]
MKNKKIYIEILRIIAILCVIFNHTGNAGFSVYTITSNPINYHFSLFMSVLCKIGVPIFFMISGALLLGKDESIKTVLFYRVLKYIVIIIFASTFYYIYDIIYCKTDLSVIQFIKKIYNTNYSYQLWFLYSYLSYLIMLPILRSIVKSISENTYKYCIIVQLIFCGVIPIINFILKINNRMEVSVPIMTSQNIFFAMIGYYFGNLFDINKLRKKDYIKMILTSVTSVVISEIMTFMNYLRVGSYDESYYNLFVAIPTITIFILVKKYSKSIKYKRQLEI